MSTLTKISFSKSRLFEGKPYCKVGNEWWDGFHSSRGVIFVKVENRKTWVEHHGDVADLSDGGGVIKPTGDLEKLGFNLMVGGLKQRLLDHPTLWYGAINKHRVQRGVPAITVYNQHDSVLTDYLRFEGEVWTATVKDPITTHPEPLNFWIETDGRVEF